MNDFARCLIMILLFGLAVGCQKNAAPTAPESLMINEDESTPAPAAITPVEPRVAVETPETPRREIAAPPEVFVEAERNFAEGNYRQAAQAFERFLRAFPISSNRDRALFYLGFSLALSGNDRDLLQTEAALRRLIVEFPKSSYRRQAEWILGLMTRIEQLQSDVKDRDEQIRQLSGELNKLRSIDLDRRPSRPE